MIISCVRRAHCDRRVHVTQGTWDIYDVNFTYKYKIYILLTVQVETSIIRRLTTFVWLVYDRGNLHLICCTLCLSSSQEEEEEDKEEEKEREKKREDERGRRGKREKVVSFQERSPLIGPLLIPPHVKSTGGR